MNGESGAATAALARRWPANQLELVSSSSRLPGLVAGELSHIWELRCWSPASRDVRPRPASQPHCWLSWLACCRWMFARQSC